MLLLGTDAIPIIQYGKGPHFESLSQMFDDSEEDVHVTVISLDEQTVAWCTFAQPAPVDYSSRGPVSGVGPFHGSLP